MLTPSVPAASPAGRRRAAGRRDLVGRKRALRPQRLAGPPHLLAWNEITSQELLR